MNHSQTLEPAVLNTPPGPPTAPSARKAEAVAQPDGRIRWKDAFSGIVALARDNDDTTQVFKIIDALSGRFQERNVERMRAHPVGRRLLDEEFSLLPVLSDREHLRSLPEGSLGRVYLAFMETEGLTADGLASASDEGVERKGDDVDQRTFGQLARDSHDLWHVLTGYGRDPLGELCLLGVLTSQIRNRGTGFIAIAGIPQVRREYRGAPVMRAVLEGFRIGRRAEWMIAQDWPELLKRPLDEVRSTLGLAPPTLYRRSLPLHDASRSRSKAAAAKARAARDTAGAQQTAAGLSA